MGWNGESRRISVETRRRQQAEHDRQVGPRIKTLRAQGCSWRVIAEKLNAEGLRAPRGGTWQSHQVFRVAQRLERLDEQLKDARTRRRQYGAMFLGMLGLLTGIAGSLNRKLRPSQVLRPVRIKPVLISVLIGLLIWNVYDNALSNAELEDKNAELEDKNEELTNVVNGSGVKVPEFVSVPRPTVPDAAVRYAEEQTRAGNVEKALKILERIDGPYHRRHDLVVAVVRTLTEMNELGKAEEVAANISDVEARSHAFQVVASAQAEAGRIRDAIKTASGAIKEDAYREATLSVIAGILASTGRFQEARELVGTIKHAASRADAFRLIGLYYATGGHLDEALAIANKEMENSLGRDVVLSQVARALALQGRFQEAVKLANTMDNDSPGRDWSLVEIVWIQAMEGNIDDAVKNAHAIEGGYDRDKALYKVVWALMSMERFQEAEVTAGMIEDKARRQRTLDVIHRAYETSAAR